MEYSQLNVKLSQVKRAIDKSQSITDEWQAETIEIILLPKVYRRFKQANSRYPEIEITRIDGLAYRDHEREANEAIGERNGWSEFAGYTMRFSKEGWAWNSVREDYYGHSAGACWDGIRRETYHSFAEDLRSIYYAHIRGQDIRKECIRWLDNLANFGIVLVNDLTETEG